MIKVALALLGIVLLHGGTALAQANRAASRAQSAPDPAYAQVEDQPGLPRVLLIGDSISIGYTLDVRELLRGRANVHRPATNCGPTTNGLANLDKWLGDKPWDVIHFNWGLHDLKYINDKGDMVSPDQAGARQQVPPAEYEKNLRALVDRLKRTGAELVWCATTPVPPGSTGRIADDSVAYNQIAARIMQEQGIAVDDLHAFVAPRIKEIQRPANVHFTDAGSKALAGQVVASIEAALQRPFLVLSYNIRYQNNQDGEDQWSKRSGTVAETLKAADVVGLQEVLPVQLDDLKKQLTGFEFYGVGRDDGQLAGEMVPIGFRRERFTALERGTFWLSPTPEAVGVKGWDAALPRIASWMRLQERHSGKRWLVVNTHFDHRGVQARLESGRLLRKWIHDQRQEMPVVLLGDFNARQSDKPVEAMTGGSSESSSPPLRVARDESPQADSGPDSTWNGFKAIQPGQRIDHILLSGPVRVLKFKTLDPRTAQDRFASDHLPIQALITFGTATNITQPKQSQ